MARTMSLKFRPKFEKIIELMLYIAHARPNADKYQVVKLMYLADREHINTYGRPITFEQYAALPFGPVASNAMDLMEGDRYTFRKAGISELPFEVGKKLIDAKEVACLSTPKRDVDFDVFSKSDIRIMDDIIERFGNKTFDELFNITHEHEAYKRAWRRRGTSRSSPMLYEEMIEDDSLRGHLLEDIAPIAMKM
jgi:uncharacterized phage-associated protein